MPGFLNPRGKLLGWFRRFGQGHHPLAQFPQRLTGLIHYHHIKGTSARRPGIVEVVHVSVFDETVE